LLGIGRLRNAQAGGDFGLGKLKVFAPRPNRCCAIYAAADDFMRNQFLTVLVLLGKIGVIRNDNERGPAGRNGCSSPS